jgi:hypothetical protein
LQHKKSFAGLEVRLPVWASIQGHSIGGCCGHCTLQESRHLSSNAYTKKGEREREEQFARLSHACSASEASTVKTALGSKQEFPLLWTACLPWFQFLFSGPHTFMPDEKSMQILLTFASLLMDFCSGGRNVAYAYNRKEAKAGVARYTGTSDLHFGMATSTETTHAIVAPTCVNNFDLLVCHMTYCHILSHIVTYCHILSHIVTLNVTYV